MPISQLMDNSHFLIKVDRISARFQYIIEKEFTSVGSSNQIFNISNFTNQIIQIKIIDYIGKGDFLSYTESILENFFIFFFF